MLPHYQRNLLRWKNSSLNRWFSIHFKRKSKRWSFLELVGHFLTSSWWGTACYKTRETMNPTSSLLVCFYLNAFNSLLTNVKSLWLHLRHQIWLEGQWAIDDEGAWKHVLVLCIWCTSKQGDACCLTLNHCVQSTTSLEKRHAKGHHRSVDGSPHLRDLVGLFAMIFEEPTQLPGMVRCCSKYGSSLLS